MISIFGGIVPAPGGAWQDGGRRQGLPITQPGNLTRLRYQQMACPASMLMNVLECLGVDDLGVIRYRPELS